MANRCRMSGIALGLPECFWQLAVGYSLLLGVDFRDISLNFMVQVHKPLQHGGVFRGLHNFAQAGFHFQKVIERHLLCLTAIEVWSRHRSVHGRIQRHQVCTVLVAFALPQTWDGKLVPLGRQ